MARTPFKLKSGNSPLAQSKFGGKKINVGKGISKFFSDLRGAGETVVEGVTKTAKKVESDVGELVKTDVPKQLAGDVKKTAKKYLGKDAVEARKTKQKAKNEGTKYEGMTSFEKRMAKRKEARKPKR